MGSGHGETPRRFNCRATTPRFGPEIKHLEKRAKNSSTSEFKVEILHQNFTALEVHLYSACLSDQT